FSVGAIRRYSKPGASVGKQSRSTLLATRPAPPLVNSPRHSASPRRVCGGYAKLTGRPARYRSLRRSGIECALLTSPVAVDQLRLPGSAVVERIIMPMSVLGGYGPRAPERAGR